MGPGYLTAIQQTWEYFPRGLHDRIKQAAQHHGMDSNGALPRPPPMYGGG